MEGERTHFPQVLEAVIEIPLLPTKLGPVIVHRTTPPHPAEVIETTASAQYLASGVVLLRASIVRAIDHRGLICPIVLALDQIKCQTWRRYLLYI